MIRFYKPTLKRIDMDCVLQTMVDDLLAKRNQIMEANNKDGNNY